MTIFCYLKLLCLDEIKFWEMFWCVSVFKRKLTGFSANTIGYYVRGLFTHFLCPNLKVLTLPQLSLIIVGAPITII